MMDVSWTFHLLWRFLSSDLAATYAALILADEDLEITVSITKMSKANRL